MKDFLRKALEDRGAIDDRDRVTETTTIETPDGQLVTYKRGVLAPGHKKLGGRGMGGPQRKVRLPDVGEIIARLEARLDRKINPLEALLTIAMAPASYLAGLGWTQTIKVNGEDVSAPIPIDVRIDCLKAALPYVQPKPVVAPGGRENKPASLFDVDALLRDPKLAKAAQQLAIALVVKTRDPEPELRGQIVEATVEDSATD